MIYDLYESKQRKVFWAKARKKIAKEIKKDADSYGVGNYEFMDKIVDHKKVWQQPHEERIKLYNILISNISREDLQDIKAEYRIKDDENAMALYKGRLNIYLKLGFVDEKPDSNA